MIDGPDRPQRPVDHPDWSALHGAFADLRKQVARAKDVQKKVFHLTATAWSPDRMIKVVVGPRGQLVDLDIDPRVYRQPNSKALARSILETSRQAIEQIAQQTEQILDHDVPADLRIGRTGAVDFRDVLKSHDAELPKKVDAEEDD
ncbi:YbaB/EbfC family nucleoid-associated protein [Actinocatenispora sera]|uniref:YbaB/EbfC family nucleoid-associated protein n=1 Tax=Actinocatenispora sera TaxID=390989 RepID=UPI0033F85158